MGLVDGGRKMTDTERLDWLERTAGSVEYRFLYVVHRTESGEQLLLQRWIVGKVCGSTLREAIDNSKRDALNELNVPGAGLIEPYSGALISGNPCSVTGR